MLSDLKLFQKPYDNNSSRTKCHHTYSNKNKGLVHSEGIKLLNDGV